MIKIEKIQWYIQDELIRFAGMDSNEKNEAYNELVGHLPTELIFPNEDFNAWMEKKGLSLESFKSDEEFINIAVDGYTKEVFGYLIDGIVYEGSVVEKELIPKQNYKVDVSDFASYVIKASNEEEAMNQAWDYFHERIPCFNLILTEEPAEVEV